jgi:hypothetical protein
MLASFRRFILIATPTGCGRCEVVDGAFGGRASADRRQRGLPPIRAILASATPYPVSGRAPQSVRGFGAARSCSDYPCDDCQEGDQQNEDESERHHAAPSSLTKKVEGMNLSP